mgnify:CR=1 FL=1
MKFLQKWSFHWAGGSHAHRQRSCGPSHDTSGMQNIQWIKRRVCSHLSPVAERHRTRDSSEWRHPCGTGDRGWLLLPAYSPAPSAVRSGTTTGRSGQYVTTFYSKFFRLISHRQPHVDKASYPKVPGFRAASDSGCEQYDRKRPAAKQQRKIARSFRQNRLPVWFQLLLYGYEEPEILCYQINPVRPKSADVRHPEHSAFMEEAIRVSGLSGRQGCPVFLQVELVIIVFLLLEERQVSDMNDVHFDDSVHTKNTQFHI